MALTAATLALRSPWLTELEETTRAWRFARAEVLERESSLMSVDEHACFALDGTFAGVDIVETWRNSPWHTARAWAHRERFERLANCGQRTRREKCACPGDSPGTKPTVVRCDHWRLCLECKGRRCARYRARFVVGRERARQRNEKHTRRFATGGVWSEKFCTFTTPHAHISRDVESLHSTWSLFRGSLSRYFKRTGVKRWKEIPYWRSLEVTKSDGGHAHFHVWMLAPFLPVHLVRHYWGRAMPKEYRDELPVLQLSRALADTDPRNHRELRKAAVLDRRLASIVHDMERQAANARARHRYACSSKRPRGDIAALEHYALELTAEARQARDESSFLFSPVVDVRRPSKDIANELVKYIVKDSFTDTDGVQRPLDAELFARIYASLEGKRAVTTSAHLVDDVPLEKRDPFCACCGVEREVVFVWTDAGPSSAVATSPPHASSTHHQVAA